MPVTPSYRNFKSVFCIQDFARATDKYFMDYNGVGRHEFSRQEIIGLKRIDAISWCGSKSSSGYPQRCGRCNDCVAFYHSKHKATFKETILSYPHLFITLHTNKLNCKHAEQRKLAIDSIREVFEGAELGGYSFFHASNSDMSPAPHFHFVVCTKGLFKKRRRDLIDLAGGLKKIEGILRTIWTGTIGCNDPGSVHIERAGDEEAIISYGCNGVFSKTRFLGNKENWVIQYKSKGEWKTMRKGRAFRNAVHSLALTKGIRKHYGFGFYSKGKAGKKLLAFMRSGKFGMFKK